MIKEYELISFDAGGTLLTPYPSVGEIYSREAKRYGCNVAAGEIESAFRRLWHRRDAMKNIASGSSEKIEKEWWYSLVFEVFDEFGGVDDFEAFFEDLYELFAGPDCWRLFPETVHVLTELKKRGKRLCVISNWDSRLSRVCEGLELSQYFEFILISAVFGASKPSPEIFREAAKRAGVPTEKIVHVGDSLEDDIRGAHSCGIRGILIDRNGRKPENPDHFEDVSVIHNLSEILRPQSEI